MKKPPRICVVTPFYNTAEYLRECIESVLAQTVGDWEYLLVDNCSSDGSLAIAEEYASRDPRIRVVRFEEFVGQVPNYNRALRLISDECEYVKIVQADDWIFPDCLRLMTEVADGNPSVGIVSAYTAIGENVWLTGLKPPETHFTGRDIARRFFLQGLYLFGSPTCVLFRADLVRGRAPFYRLDSPFEDAEVCYDLIRNCDVGFVHQVLTYTRRDNTSIMSRLSRYHSGLVTRVLVTKRYGPDFLSNEEFQASWSVANHAYYKALGEDVWRLRGRDYWQFQREAMMSEGIQLHLWKIGFYALRAALELALNPWQTIERIAGRVGRAREIVAA